MPAPAAILFDFDGVLADTENVHVAAWERIFQAMGLDIPPEVCARAAEIEDHLFLADVLLSSRIEGDVAGWVERKRQLTISMLADEPRLYPGVADLCAWLAPRAKLAIVSTAPRAVIDIVLLTSRLQPLFSLIIAREDVDRPKPDPTPYATARRRLGLPASSVRAIEDSPTGLASALAAGVPCLALGHRRQPGPWCQDVPYISDLRDTAAVLQALDFPRERSTI